MSSEEWINAWNNVNWCTNFTIENDGFNFQCPEGGYPGSINNFRIDVWKAAGCPDGVWTYVDCENAGIGVCLMNDFCILSWEHPDGEDYQHAYLNECGIPYGEEVQRCCDGTYDCGDGCPTDSDDDGVCDYLETEGCTDLNACNYNSYATLDDGSCISKEEAEEEIINREARLDTSFG